MKRQQLLFSFTLATAVLFSILFQSFHGYAHLEDQISQHVCQHEHSHNKAEITHQHKTIEHCAICHFEFGNCLYPKFISYHFFSEFKSISFFSKEQKAIISFSGSLYAHRGPPVGMV
ncbi:hypothetical protein [Flavobacterium seoulense]|uniref:DUF2946 domain-containing protein n=1 Tax=Flavobacterium seoulense TaxID=1492738 RepID=A0A066WWL2_9FLAO|nr:hypothetical protein [Flavobacterium seoulense]KDN55055.1 hypothetical protein FEM21_16460 [Flavobacterium seoulense]